MNMFVYVQPVKQGRKEEGQAQGKKKKKNDFFIRDFADLINYTALGRERSICQMLFAG